jgi:hypothetical protein
MTSVSGGEIQLEVKDVTPAEGETEAAEGEGEGEVAVAVEVGP